MKKPSEVDALFALPLAEFVAARNALAARLKKEGRAEDSQRVKALAKPSATAWAVNQLYWSHRRDFDRLVTISGKVRQAQSGRGGDLRSLVEQRRAIVAALADVAAERLNDAGHARSVDARRRVITTLESLAARDESGIERLAGRLTVDLEPLGFDSLAGLLEGAPLQTAKVLDFRQAADGKRRTADKQREEAERAARARAEAERHAREEAGRRAKALEDAEAALTHARREAARAEAAASKAIARREAVEQEKREIEARYAAAIADADAAADEAEESARRVADAERAVAAARAGA